MTDGRHASEVGVGGLSFWASESIASGTLVHIRIPYTQPEFETEAKVVWCRSHERGAELGVEFLSADDAFRARMVEQVCHIENYKHAVKRKEGRDLTIQEAALEWVTKYASDFPRET